MARSITAIVVGFLLIGALSVGAGALVQQLAPSAFAPDGTVTSLPVLAATLAYVAVFAILGCYVCARLAPGQPLKHAMILGALGLAFNAAGSYAAWSAYPVWFHAIGLATTLPYAWIGGSLREREVARAQLAVAT